MSAITVPNYTQIPNVLLDEWMSILTPAEFKVIMCIARKTFGWSKTVDKISLRQIEELTGLSRMGISKCIASLINHGLVAKISSKTQDGDSSANRYEIHVNSVGGGSKLSLPGVVNSVYPQKKDYTKEKKEIKKKDETPAVAVALTDFFLAEIKKRKPNSSCKITAEWKKAANKLLAVRKPKEIRALIEFAFSHEFWFPNVLSPMKLLKHLDALEIAMAKGLKTISGVSPIQKEENNRKMAVEIGNAFPDDVKKHLIIIGTTYIEFKHPSGLQADVIPFSSHGFEEQVRNCLRKLGKRWNK